MKRYSRFQKIILIVVFIIELPLSGCYISKPLSKSDLPVKEKTHYIIIRDGRSKYQFKHPVFTENAVSGELRAYSQAPGKKIYLYLQPDSSLDLHKKSHSTVTFDKIARVETRKTRVFLTTVSAVAALIVLTPLKYLFSE